MATEPAHLRVARSLFRVFAQRRMALSTMRRANRHSTQPSSLREFCAISSVTDAIFADARKPIQIARFLIQFELGQCCLKGVRAPHSRPVGWDSERRFFFVIHQRIQLGSTRGKLPRGDLRTERSGNSAFHFGQKRIAGEIGDFVVGSKMKVSLQADEGDEQPPADLPELGFPTVCSRTIGRAVHAMPTPISRSGTRSEQHGSDASLRIFTQANQGASA